MNRRCTVLALCLSMLAAGVCTARADDPAYLYGGVSGSFTPGHAIPVSYYTNVAGPTQVSIYALPLSMAAAAGYLGRAYEDPAPRTAGLTRVLLLAAVASDKRQPNLRTATIPVLPIGLYVVSAGVAKTSVTSVVDMTTMGVVLNVVKDARSFYAVDLRTFLAYGGKPGLTVHDGKAMHDVAFSHDLAEYAGALHSDAPYAVATAPDGSVQFVSLDADDAPTDVGYVQSDRPIYRPGQTMYFRAIVRRGGVGRYSIPTGARMVTVTTPDNTIAYRHDLPLSSFGTIQAKVQLPQDAATGMYQVNVGDLQTSVTVAAYKKPEYTIDFSANQKYVIGGDRATFTLSARYFFGQPAAGFHLHYVAYKEQRAVWSGPYAGIEGVRVGGVRAYEPVKVAEGDFVTDASGSNVVALGTEKTAVEEHLDVRVDGRDASGRTISTDAGVRVVPASFSIALSPAQWFAQAGVVTTISVATIGYDGKPHAGTPVSVQIVGARWDDKRKKDVAFSQTSAAVSTDASGNANLTWTPHEAGSYSFTAKAVDERGNTATGTLYLWAVGADQRAYFAPIEQPLIVAQKESYRIGERPRLLVTLPKAGRDALLLISTDRLISERVLHFSGQTMAVDVDEPRDAASFIVTVELPNGDGVSTAQQTIPVHPAPKTLQVTIVPGKARYAPGERARWNILARDARGMPVRAELGIGVVDEAIYAVQSADTQTVFDALYGEPDSPNPTFTWSPPNTFMLRSMSSSFSPGPLLKLNVPHLSVQAGPSIRSNFQDTAFWAGSVVTDARGEASISFVWPDNLTTWRATGMAVTKNTDVGQASADALVTKDFLVRLETPRFLRVGDRSQIVGIAQGQAAHPNVTLGLQADPALFAPASAALTLDSNRSADTSWPFIAPGVGSVLLTLSGSDGTLKDAMQSTLPLEAATAPEHVRDAGSLPSASSIAVALPPGYVAGDVHLTLSPSIVAELVQNVRLLQIYPYYCTEQTVSTALPAIFIDRILKRGGLPQPGDVDTGQIVREAIARLNQLQHDDGSWGWWQYDDAHPFMTAYAMYALSQFRSAGYDVPGGTFDRGVQSLVGQLAASNGDTLRFWGGAQRGSEWNTRAFMLFALAQAAPDKVDRNLLAQTKAHVGNLNPYAIAVLGLAEHALGDDATARDLAGELDKRATDDGAYTYWHGDTWHYAWEDDPIETTAYALRLEVAVNPQSPRIPKIVAFLRAQRRGDWWYTTKDTAASIDALSEALQPDPSEFHPDETIRVLVDGKPLRTLHVTSPILDAADASVVVPAGSLHDGSTVAFERSGRGALYWSSDAVRYLPPSAQVASDVPKGLLARLFASPPDLTISRSYDVGHDGPWRVGDLVRVTLRVEAHSDVQYVAIEDPFPAAAEPQPDQGRAADAAWSGLQLLDDRAVFFADRLYDRRPITLSYNLRVTTAGTYTAPPPSVSAMYGPPVSALGSPTTVVVAP